MLMHQLLIDGAARTPDKIVFHWVDRDGALRGRAEQNRRAQG